MFRSGRFPAGLFARLLPLQEAQLIFETILSLSLIGVVGAIVRAVGWWRDAPRSSYVRRSHRNR
jgi:hypothetical protein